MSEIARFEAHEIEGYGGYLYLYAPHSGAIDSRMAIRGGEVVVDFSDRGTIIGVEYLIDLERGSLHDFVVRGLLSWEEYEAKIYAEVEAKRLEKLNLPERLSSLEIDIKVPGNPANN